MKILILGGTGFLGPHVVEYAVSRQHTVTLFNRGRTRPDFFPELEKLRGDRNDDLKALEGRSWDAVIDTSANLPRWVRGTAELLKDRIRQYVFVSSCSVYDRFETIGIDETHAVGKLEDESIEQVTGETFGPLKAACERTAEAILPGRVTVVRPGLIVGPLDNSDRFTYWPHRIDRGGEVLAPAPMDTPVQFIDARDLARFMVGTIEDGHVGIYNATGPIRPLSMAETLHGIRAISSSDVRFTWVDGVFLAAHDVGPWMELPLWVPAEGEMVGFARVSNEKARSIGLRFRPLAETAADTLAWSRTRGEEHRWRAGLASEKEQRVLQAWNNR